MSECVGAYLLEHIQGSTSNTSHFPSKKQTVKFLTHPSFKGQQRKTRWDPCVSGQDLSHTRTHSISYNHISNGYSLQVMLH